MALLSLLFPAWETCSPLIEVPDLLVTGARPAYEASWALAVKVLPRVSARKTAAAGTPIPGTGGQDRVKRVGLHQSLDLGCNLGPLVAQRGELPGQVVKDRPGGISACHGYGLFSQGIADLLGPGRMGPGSVFVQLGSDTGFTCLFQCGGGGPGCYGLQDCVVFQAGSQNSLKSGVDLGVQASNAVSCLVDLTCQVQVKTSEHGQCCGLLVGRGDIA